MNKFSVRGAVKGLALAATLFAVSPAFASIDVPNETLQKANQAVEAPAQVQPAVVSTVPTVDSDIKGLNKENKKAARKARKEARRAAGKSQLVALLLCLFLGGMGIHRFYLGYIWQGVVQLLTGGGLGIWALIDLIRIITGSLEPKNESYSSTF